MQKIFEFFNNNKKIILLSFVFSSLFLYGLLKTPDVMGDGYEYVGTTVAIKNHLTPNLLETDLKERREIARRGENITHWPDEIFDRIEYMCYRKTTDGEWYGIHFWAYSMLCAIFLPLFYFLKIDPLKIFQFTNCLLLIYAAIRKNKYAIMSILLLLGMAFVDSTQINWNSGMNLLNRYSFWMIPVIIFGVIDFINTLTKKAIVVLSILYLLTTSVWLPVAFDRYSPNYLYFSPVAKIVLHVCPALHNPEPELFAERTMNKELVFDHLLPLSYYSRDLKRKTLIKDKVTGKYTYINEKCYFNIPAIKIEHKGKILIISKKGITKKTRE